MRFSGRAAGLALLVVGVTETLTARRGRSTVDRVGRAVVDRAPLPLVEETVRLLGTTDKPVLRGGLLTAVATAAGLLGSGDRRSGRLPAGSIPATVGLAAYAASRRQLAARAARHEATRRPLVVPDAAPRATDGAEGWAGAEPLYTDVGRFYRTDVNLRAPLVDVDGWRLRVECGDHAEELAYDDLIDLGLRERDALLVCVHNRLGWDRLGHQRWTGIPVAEVLRAADVEVPDDPAGTDLVMEAVDGYRQVMPLATALDRDAWVVLGMAGQQLPAGHGFPARVMTPGVVGQYNGVKWLRTLRLVPAGTVEATWVERGWPRATVVPPPMARIDHPRTRRMPPHLPQRPVAVARAVTLVGTAWAPANGGVAAVHVAVNDGQPIEAELAADLGAASWRRWRVALDLAPAAHTIRAWATAADGTVQSATVSPPFPDGATGHHTVAVQVR